MKKIVVLAAAFAVSGLFAGPAFAQTSPNGDPPCSYDIPFKANSLKASFVRAFAACGGSSTFPAPNSVLGATNTDACFPATPLSDFLYGERGACSIKIKTKTSEGNVAGDGKRNKCFPDDSVENCNITSLKVKCRDIVEADGLTLLDESNLQGPEGLWKLNTFTRATLDDRVNGGGNKCVGGVNDQKLCPIGASDCPDITDGTCDVGVTDVCIGGLNPGADCTFPVVNGTCDAGLCSGGANPGADCTSDGDCLGETCLGEAGTCVISPNPDGGGATAIDFPVVFKFPLATNGQLKGKFNANEALKGLLGFGSALPQCSSLELLSIVISDSSASPFGAMGVSSGSN